MECEFALLSSWERRPLLFSISHSSEFNKGLQKEECFLPTVGLRVPYPHPSVLNHFLEQSPEIFIPDCSLLVLKLLVCGTHSEWQSAKWHHSPENEVLVHQ